MLSKDDIQRRQKMWETVLDNVHGFFESRGFEYFRTPLLVRTPGMEPNLDPIETTATPSRSINGGETTKLALITSPEYSMKKLLGAGFDKVYTVTPVFRNFETGNHNLLEFIMLEWYGQGEYEDLMNETENLLKFVLKDESDWPRLSHHEARVDKHGDPQVDLQRFFVTRYPVDQAALAKISNDGTYAERFEAFADGLELCNGFAELTDPVEQRKRFEIEQEERRAAGKKVWPIDEDLLEALGKIKNPVYGNALGLDRLVMLRYGISDINDIQIFSGL
ncbi:MAG: amino acid--tRNA ligase-related protein [Patescibacteria group bacterium]